MNQTSSSFDPKEAAAHGRTISSLPQSTAVTSAWAEGRRPTMETRFLFELGVFDPGAGFQIEMFHLGFSD